MIVKSTLKTLLLSTFLWLCIYSHSQDAVPIKPSAYAADIKVNYVRTWESSAPITDPNELLIRPLKDVKQSTQYIDGLGRPLQTVIKGGSFPTGGTAVDLVAPVVYDEYGREVRKYLPYASTENNGLFKVDPFSGQVNFYSDDNFNSPIKGQGESFYYGKTEYEASPLNRVERSYASGNAWVNQGKGVKMKYWINTANDEVRIWNVTDVTNGLGTYSTPRIYPAGELYKNVSVDEHDKQVIEFKDKEGKVILKKVQLTASADDGNGTGYQGWLCTYYIYDDINQLRAVIQPKGVEALVVGGWSLTASLLDEQCFRYGYDEQGRMVIKKVPGAAEVWLVYDGRDRLVLSQDGNQRAQSQWLYYQYDELNRPIASGLWDNNQDRAYHKAQAYNSTAYPALSNQSYEELTHTFYDNYDWLSSNSGHGFSAALSTVDNSYLLPASNSTFPYPQPLTQSGMIRGYVTGTKTRVLSTNQDLYSINYYDEKGRVIQTQAQNISGGADIITTQYSFSGQPLLTILRQQKGGNNAQTHIIVTKNSYDDLGRQTKAEKNLNSTGWKAISAIEYNALGQVKKKKLSPDYNSGGGLETLTYDYNIRGWLLGANRDYIKDANTSHYFGFELGYDKPSTIINGTTYTQQQYNGNIAGMTWKSKGDGEKRKYDFIYDPVNRLLNADFNQYTNNSFNKDAQVDFSVQMGDGSNAPSAYDGNGNILAMQQKGLQLNASAVIDQLSYTYQAGSNKLSQVIDAANDNQSKLGDFKYDGATKGATDYGYDSNGNLISDANKKITAIQYNHLNLPQLIEIRDKGTIEYTYDAAGNKLKKVTTDNTINPAKVTTTLYLGGSVYENDTLQFISHEEGRIRYKTAINDQPASFQWDYFVKDHLGNVRMVLTEEQQTNAYPVASMEEAQATIEEALYSNLNTTRVDKPAGYPDDNYTTPNDKVAKVRGDGQKIGPSIILKVMAGDKVNIQAKSWYQLNNTTTNSPVNPLTELITALGNSIGSIAGGKATATELVNSGILTPNAAEFLNSQSSYNPGKPKAFLNWMLLDEQFKYVSASSGFDQVGSDGELKHHVKPDLSMAKNGYLYIYTSNETPNIDVFFDNLQVSHNRGPLTEENHYYPFGLTMAGISSRAAGSLENKVKFTSQLLDDDLGWNTYQMRWRTMDPQIGRFLQIDPLASDYVHNSTYAYAENDVIRAIDLEGLEKFIITNRSFHPDGTFGGGFSGDSRNFTTQDNKYTTSRVEQKVNVDFTDKTSSAAVRSDPSHHPVLGTDQAIPTQKIEQVQFTDNPNGTTSFDLKTSYAGANPLVPGSPDIDVKTNMSLTITGKDNQFLSVAANMKGDAFPAAESYIKDANGTAAFIGVAPIPKGGDPRDLIGDNNRRMFSTGFTIELDKKGNFSGNVIYDGVKYPIAQWNKTFGETPVKK